MCSLQLTAVQLLFIHSYYRYVLHLKPNNAGAAIAKRLNAGLQENRTSYQSCIWDMVHIKTHFIGPSCPSPSTVQNCDLKHSSFHFFKLNNAVLSTTPIATMLQGNHNTKQSHQITNAFNTPWSYTTFQNSRPIITISQRKQKIIDIMR